MHKKRFLNIVIFLTLLVALGVNIHSRNTRVALPSIENELKSVMPAGDFFEKNEEPFLYYSVYKNRTLIGYCFNTHDVVPGEKGYGGPMDILVGLDRNCNIKDLRILRHRETPEYTVALTSQGFLNQFKGKGPADRFIIGEAIDAITQATISSKAVAAVLSAGVNRISREVLGAGEEGPAGTTQLNLTPDFYITLLIITFLLGAFYIRITWFRYLGMAASVIYFGFVRVNFISMSNLGSIFLWNLPPLRQNPEWFIFIFSGLILTFLLGRFYCSYICPFGGLQRFLKRLSGVNIKITPVLGHRLRRVRYILLWALTVIVLAVNNPNVVNYEPFSTVFLRRGSVIAWSVAAIVLVLSLFYYRPFCNYFCAAGAFLDILSDWGRKALRKNMRKG